MRQKIQLELALGSEGKGEAQTAAPGGTETRAAALVTENLAAAGPSMEAIVERDNVRKALAQVRRNKGAPGVDDMSVEDLALHLKDHWLEIKAQLLAGTYRPQPVRRVEIPKPTGGVRELRDMCSVRRTASTKRLPNTKPRSRSIAIQTGSTSGVLRFTVSTVSYLTHYLWNH